MRSGSRRRAFVGLTLLLLATVSAAMAQTGTLLAPTGPLAVGRLVLHWRDESRREVLSSRPTDKREVAVWFWYPATNVTAGPKAPYINQLDALAPSLSDDEVALARSVQTHAVANAPLVNSPARLPVILFSPGSGSLPALYSSYMEDLASRGYVIAALDHPYDDLAVRLLDGRVEKEASQPTDGDEFLRYQRGRVTVRTEDVRFVVDQLSRMQQGEVNSPFRGRLDLAHIAVFGHSTGGLTAAEACMRDSRIKACANLDGMINAQPAFADSQGRGPTRPFLFIAKPLPAMPAEKPEEAKQRLNLLRQRGNALLAGVRQGRSYRITVDGATHSTFSDEEIISDANAPRHLLDLTRSYLRAFFDEALLGGKSTLLNAASTDKAIQIEIFTPH